MSDYDVVVIGAGLGGLTAGALLAHQGRRVLVLEQSERIGGCCSTFEKDGYRFDLGASIIEVIHPIEVTFEKLGTRFQDEVDLIPCDPVLSVIQKDGSRTNFPLSVEETGAVIASISPEDGKRWFDFVAYMSELVDVTLNTVFIEPADSLTDMVRMIRKDPRLAKFLPTFLSSYQSILERFFKNEKVLSAMGYQSLYLGFPPALVPGAFAMLPYTEHMGVYYPRGGMIKIPEALRRCGERLGMEVRCNSPVAQVIVRGGTAQGVVLEDGTEVRSRLVVSNVNAKTLYLKMIGEEHLPPLARSGIKSYNYSKAVPMIYLGMDAAPPLEAHHSMIAVTPQQVNEYWWNYLEAGRLLDENFGLICWPTFSDPSLAPAGHHIVNLIPEGFYHLNGTDWDTEKPFFVERMLEYYSRFAVPGLADHARVVECATPLDFERRLRMPEGAIYALQQDLLAVTVLRPAARSKSIKGLYLTGASAHPGGGVPSTIASGLIAANLIEKYEA